MDWSGVNGFLRLRSEEREAGSRELQQLEYSETPGVATRYRLPAESCCCVAAEPAAGERGAEGRKLSAISLKPA